MTFLRVTDVTGDGRTEPAELPNNPVLPAEVFYPELRARVGRVSCRRGGGMRLSGGEMDEISQHGEPSVTPPDLLSCMLFPQ